MRLAYGDLPSTTEANRLEALFGDISRSVAEGRLESALRYADCALRVAPDDATCLLVFARLLMRLGNFSAAAERLQSRSEPQLIVARGEALCALDLLDDAVECCQPLLKQHAADSVENLTQLAARLCRGWNALRPPGWVGVDTKLRVVGQLRSGFHVSMACGDSVLSPLIDSVNQDGLDSFTVEVPPDVSGAIAARLGDVPLLGSGLLWPPDFGLSGWVAVENRRLVGDVRLDWCPALPATLKVGPVGGEHIRVSVASGQPFSISLDQMNSAAGRLEVSVLLPDGSFSPLVGSPVDTQPISPRFVGERPQRTIRAEPHRESQSERVIDIIVPVYAGRDETLSCLERVQATTRRSEAELVVVNDASPDQELCEALARLAQAGCITILENPFNLGFPGAANRGMKLHPERDVVLLNADTELFGDWLRRLKCAAYSADDIATVTPLGESASITSYPGRHEYAHTVAEAEQIDRIASEVNAQKGVELPVGVGYCLYVKRACLTDVGGFDESSFSKGYGEESDFCFRARSRGWRHIAATDVFVRHQGARSYGRRKALLTARNHRVINALHPGYDALVADFIAADPLLDARRAIDMHRLLQQAVDPVLLVTFDLPGGVKRHVEERQSALTDAGHTVIILQPSGGPTGKDRVILRAQGANLENLVFKTDELPMLRDFLSRLGIRHIELHHFAGLPAAALELVTSLGVRYDVYVHDYCWICPRLMLVGGTGVYCGEPALEECETCIRTHGTELEESLTVKELRTRSAGILQRANHIIAPSHDVRTRLEPYFPGVPINVEPWEAPLAQVSQPAVQANGPIRVIVIGAISVAKGYQVLLECARDATRRDLDLEFVVIGFTHDDQALLATGRVFITGPFKEKETATLLEREQGHVAFFPSVAPETWCYALTHAMARGLPTVAFDLGAIGERLRSYSAAELLPLSTAAGEINDTLLRLARRVSTSELQKEPVMHATQTINNETIAGELAASVQVLPLPAGIYVLTVQGGTKADASSEGLILPALQVGLAPAKSSAVVEFLGRSATLDRWLARSGDMIIVKISGSGASLLLTSVRLPNSPTLSIDLRPLDAQPYPIDPELEAAAAASGLLPAHIITHVQNIGDVHFRDGWAGCIERLWIEAFSMVSVGELPPDAIEYCCITADGFQTPWLSNQLLCGSRGRGMPIVAYAVRLKAEVAERYECTYTGKFVSGSTYGPFRNGDLCRSETPGDPLWGIEVRVAARSRSETTKPSSGVHSGVAQA
jgi:GT2 family glycosyltransferase/glycosyltransferase involved in cell wall biosynthesis